MDLGGVYLVAGSDGLSVTVGLSNPRLSHGVGVCDGVVDRQRPYWRHISRSREGGYPYAPRPLERYTPLILVFSLAGDVFWSVLPQKTRNFGYAIPLPPPFPRTHVAIPPFRVANGVWMWYIGSEGRLGVWCRTWSD